MKFKIKLRSKIKNKINLSISLLLILLFLFISGCSQIANIKMEKKEVAKPIELSLQNNIKLEDIEKFKIELNEFYGFMKEYFSVWEKYSNSTQPLIEKINSGGRDTGEKSLYISQLENEYSNFLKELLNVKVPETARNAYKMGYNAISARKAAFASLLNGEDNLFTKNIDESYLYEKEFWREIDRLCGEIDLQAKKLGLGNNSVINPANKNYQGLQV